MTLARIYRIPREELKKTIQSGRRVKGGAITVNFSENSENHSRIAVVIPSKAVKSSVIRNRIRRRAKEIFKKASKLFNKNYDIVVFFYSAGNLKYGELEESMSGIFSKAKII